MQTRGRGARALGGRVDLPPHPPKGQGLGAARSCGGFQGTVSGAARPGAECSGAALGDPKEDRDGKGTCED